MKLAILGSVLLSRMPVVRLGQLPDAKVYQEQLVAKHAGPEIAL